MVGRPTLHKDQHLCLPSSQKNRTFDYPSGKSSILCSGVCFSQDSKEISKAVLSTLRPLVRKPHTSGHHQQSRHQGTKNTGKPRKVQTWHWAMMTL